jgi:hypothetical protein
MRLEAGQKKRAGSLRGIDGLGKRFFGSSQFGMVLYSKQASLTVRIPHLIAWLGQHLNTAAPL